MLFPSDVPQEKENRSYQEKPPSAPFFLPRLYPKPPHSPLSGNGSCHTSQPSQLRAAPRPRARSAAAHSRARRLWGSHRGHELRLAPRRRAAGKLRWKGSPNVERGGQRWTLGKRWTGIVERSSSRNIYPRPRELLLIRREEHLWFFNVNEKSSHTHTHTH